MLILGDYRFACEDCIRKGKVSLCTHAYAIQERNMKIFLIKGRSKRNGIPKQLLINKGPTKGGETLDKNFLLTKAVVDPELNSKCYESKCFVKEHFKFECYQLRCKAKFDDPIFDVHLDIFRSRKVLLDDQLNPVVNYVDNDSNLVLRGYQDYVRDFQERKTHVDELNERATIRVMTSSMAKILNNRKEVLSNDVNLCNEQNFDNTSDFDKEIKSNDYDGLFLKNEGKLLCLDIGQSLEFDRHIYDANGVSIVALELSGVAGPPQTSNLEASISQEYENPIDVFIDGSVVNSTEGLQNLQRLDVELELDQDFDGLDFNYKTINRNRVLEECEPPLSDDLSTNSSKKNPISYSTGNKIASTKFDRLFKELFETEKSHESSGYPNKKGNVQNQSTTTVKTQHNSDEQDFFTLAKNLEIKSGCVKEDDLTNPRHLILQENRDIEPWNTSKNNDLSLTELSSGYPCKSVVLDSWKSRGSLSFEEPINDASKVYYLDSNRSLKSDGIEFFFEDLFRTPIETAKSAESLGLNADIMEKRARDLFLYSVPLYDDGDMITDDETRSENNGIGFSDKADAMGYLEGLTSSRYSNL